MGVLSLGRGGRLLRFDGFCSVIGITVMRRKQYEEPEDEPCLLSPEDDPAMLDTPEDEPVGPEWWEGRWPAGGIASLEDLERWVDSHLNEMISLNWTHPRLGNIARMIGRQAVRNATRYLDRNGRGDHPSQPIPQGLRTTFSCVFEGFLRELSSNYIINTNCDALYSPITYRKVATK